MPEAIRLVVWDLDDTFWHGTVTEGGIRSYVQAHHDIVVQLARRGIMSSICSKNDEETILPILDAHGVRDYFLFPSISWGSKGPRIAALIEDFQLRPETVLFIDDHPGNRAEAEQTVPGLQIEPETFIPRLLEDPRLQGKDDHSLSRLQQYRLMEARKRDARATGTSTPEVFLMGCNVRVLIEYDVEAHLDRAIELINRTNQLNYTKKRLSENLETAREELRVQLRGAGSAAGLIRVADKYGDYGYVGFFLLRAMRSAIVPGDSNRDLVHFCFSCRTLGMLIEQWTYDHLERPELTVVGDVVTDLSVPRQYPWIRQVDVLDSTAPQQAQLAKNIVVYGGCEAPITSVYLKPYAENVRVLGNYAANGLFVRIGASAIALDIARRDAAAFAAEADLLGLPLAWEAKNFFVTGGEDTLFVVNLGVDAHRATRIRHKTQGWTFILEMRHLPGRQLLDLSPEELREHLYDPQSQYTPEQQEHILRVDGHLRQYYEQIPHPTSAELARDLRRLVECTPEGSRLIFLVDHEYQRTRYPSEALVRDDGVVVFAALLADIVPEYPFVGVARVSKVIRGVADLLDADHYQREVYLRLAEHIVDVAHRVPRRLAQPALTVNNHGLSIHAEGTRGPELVRPLDRLADGETVDQLFQLILRRPINDNAFKAEHHLSHTIGYWVDRLVQSEEFKDRYQAEIRNTSC